MENKTFTEEDITMIAFEIVAYAGEARSHLISILKDVDDGNRDLVDEKLEKANECINLAHKAQTDLLHAEARGVKLPMNLTMIHAQDHLMTTLLLKDILPALIK